MNEDVAAAATAVRIAYLERDFVCSSPVFPGDLSGSLKAAATHGVQEAAKELRLSKKVLHARPIGPLEKEDGSPFPVEEWANHYMVVVEAKPAGGLLARCNTQDALISQITTQGVEDVSLCAPEVALSSDVKQENDALKEENSALKLRIFNLEAEHQNLKNDVSAEQVQQLQLDIFKLEAEKKSLLSHNEMLKAENEALKVENNDLKKRVAFLEREVADLKREVADLKRELADVNKKMAKLTGWERILTRKMLDECRKKCRAILAASNMQVPADWNMVCQDSAMMSVLEASGLSTGLTSTKYGAKTAQFQGSRSAHDITEHPGVYADIVCKMTGAKRDRLLNVFEFVFGASAETLTFEDDMEDV